MGSTEFKLDVPAWRRFLGEWSAEVLRLLKQIPAEQRSALIERSIAEGSLLRDPATPEAVAALELRIGRSLPESYRRFLLASNGFVVHGLDAEDGALRPAEDIGWLRSNEPGLVAAWSRDDSQVPDDVYFYYGPDQDPVHLRTEYMPSTLQVSDLVDSVVILLNPEIVDARGEWEAWDFGNAFPGAYRYQSFEDLVFGLRTRTLEGLRQLVAFLPMLAARRT
jgi:hypothetical protein